MSVLTKETLLKAIDHMSMKSKIYIRINFSDEDFMDLTSAAWSVECDEENNEIEISNM